MEFDVNQDDLSRAAKRVMNLPGVFRRAKKTALKSTGWMIRFEMRDFVESAGDGTWEALHPLTSAFFKKFMTGTSRWGRSRKAQGPMFWLGKFARYRVENDQAVVGFGKSNTLNPFLMSVLRRADAGEKTPVTESMRRFFGTTRKTHGKSQTAGHTFFPLRADTKILETPRRPIMGPVMGRVKGRIVPHFEDRFWKAVSREQKEVQ